MGREAGFVGPAVRIGWNCDVAVGGKLRSTACGVVVASTGRDGEDKSARRKAPVRSRLQRNGEGEERKNAAPRAGGRQKLKKFGVGEKSKESENDVFEKQHTTLLKALTRAKVASGDTCEAIIKSGMVKVNGSVQREPFLNVNLQEDKILVGDVTLNREETHTSDSKGARDFGGGRMQELKEKTGDRYNWRVDGGFFASKRGMRGTK
mmetsp:Transcript_12310/g.26928  ORF Transcript_12310/g.26928 Transcript_12310/m.26928 type:complete len:207 (+) Transcript_12310:25-645(+)